jgi:hypothetical protein
MTGRSAAQFSSQWPQKIIPDLFLQSLEKVRRVISSSWCTRNRKLVRFRRVLSKTAVRGNWRRGCSVCPSITRPFGAAAGLQEKKIKTPSLHFVRQRWSIVRRGGGLDAGGVTVTLKESPLLGIQWTMNDDNEQTLLSDAKHT